MPLWVLVYAALRARPQVSEAGVSWREPGGAPDSWLLLKKISEAESCLHSANHHVSQWAVNPGGYLPPWKKILHLSLFLSFPAHKVHIK